MSAYADIGIPQGDLLHRGLVPLGACIVLPVGAVLAVLACTRGRDATPVQVVGDADDRVPRQQALNDLPDDRRLLRVLHVPEAGLAALGVVVVLAPPAVGHLPVGPAFPRTCKRLTGYPLRLHVALHAVEAP